MVSLFVLPAATILILAVLTTAFYQNIGEIRIMKGRSFNDFFMAILGIPIVLAWVFFACYVIWSGIKNPAVIGDLDGYTTLIAIIGGPALLIIKDALDMWKQEQNAEIQFMPVKYKHQMCLLESQQKHEIEMDSYERTNGHDGEV